MKTTTISTSLEAKARFDAYFHRRRAEALTQEGKKSYRASDAFEEIMDKAGLPIYIKPPATVEVEVKPQEEKQEVSE